MHTWERLGADLRELGLTTGDVLMVHASVRAVGEVAGGPDEIHLAMKDVLGSEGTLMMYASCPRYVDEVGRGKLTPIEEEFNTDGEGVHPNWPDRFFPQIVDAHLAASGNHGVLVGDAPSYLFRAGALLDAALPAMRATAIGAHSLI